MFNFNVRCKDLLAIKYFFFLQAHIVLRFWNFGVEEMNETTLKTARKSSGARDKLREFCSETTAHGFGRLASSSSALERLIWSACLLAALSYSIVQGYIIVSAHLSYPVDVKAEMRHFDDLEFPAVVLCNMNAVKRSALTTAIQEGLITVSIELFITVTVAS